ncbi:MAG: hypothetical protein EP346_14045 [Bacteroidetes bacterium]|nr:MAG: hypothetical protein EP346_14045 [Bacteroidota bacterium]
MKTAVKIVSGLVALLLLVGILPTGEDNFTSHAFPAGMLAFAFLWVPLFLFYRYDSKNAIHREELEKSERTEEE